MSFTPDFKPYSGIGKLRFWCQKVLPTIYDDSLSYYELLNKIVVFLNETIEDVGDVEDNLAALRDAFTQLEEYVEDQIGTVAPIVEEVIDEMVESGQFGDILIDAIAGVIAEEYDTTESYIPLNYVLYNGDLYCCTGNTSGAWDSTKWRKTIVGDELNTLMVRVYSLNAGQVSYDESATYNNDTVGKELIELNAEIESVFDAGGVIYEDCDTFVQGLFKYTPATLNIPEPGYGFVINYVAQFNNWKWQIAITTNQPTKVFIRNSIDNAQSGAWSAWKRIATEDDIATLNSAINSVFNAGGAIYEDCDTFVQGLFKYTPETLNIPEAGHGFVLNYVAQFNNWKWQIAITTNQPAKVFIRNSIDNAQSGAWSAWKRIATEDDISTLNTALTNAQGDITIINNKLSTDETNIATLTTKVNAITPLDTAPTNNSSKGVTSKGVYDALSNAQNYKSGDVIKISGMYPTITNNNGTSFTVILTTEKYIPIGATFTINELPNWIRGETLEFARANTPTPFTFSAITRAGGHQLWIDYTNSSGTSAPVRSVFITLYSNTAELTMN